jgi:DtxR family Mn-dependent transcriptional regulator
MPSRTVEDYIKQLYLEHQDGRARLVPMGRLAASVGVAPGTATAMVKTLADAGLVAYEPRGGARLTRKGEQLALHVLRRHRLIESFLVQVLGLDWSDVHREAEELEHAVSETLLERIAAYLDHPSHDPHGDPIPTPEGTVERTLLAALGAVPVGRACRIARVVDQDARFLRFIEQQGLKPGTTVTVESQDDLAGASSVRLADERLITLGTAAAAKILVKVLPKAGGPRALTGSETTGRGRRMTRRPNDRP